LEPSGKQLGMLIRRPLSAKSNQSL